MGRRAGQETKRRALVARARARTERRIIDTDSPDGASTCCVYVRSDNSISQRRISAEPQTRRKKEDLRAANARAAGVYVI
jgi:hypothetical protein